MNHLLVTNDFPPKTGGIQVYLWELWSRLDPATYAVLTASSDRRATEFDRCQRATGIRIERAPTPWLLPTPGVLGRIDELAGQLVAGLVVLDPALPLGLVGPRLGLPYAVVLHGAEVTVPGRVPLLRPALAGVLQGASFLLSAGGYPADEAANAAPAGLPPVIEIPPGVDCERFRPLSERERTAARARFDLPDEGPVIVSVSRLVPRKGMDVLIEAADRLLPSFPDLTVAIGGTGRDRRRLEGLAASADVRVRMLGRVPDEDLPDLMGCGDLFVMACRDRWAGLEQEGFGIVFLEAAASGVPQVAGSSGGAAEAVEHGVTGLVVDQPHAPGELAAAIRRILADPLLRREMGEAGRRRAETLFAYRRLAPMLARALGEVRG